MRRQTFVVFVVSALTLCPPAWPAAAVAQSLGPAEAPARTVTLALPEYHRLIDLAARGPDTDEAPAASGAAAVLDAGIDGAVARGTLTVAGTAVRAGVSRVPLVTTSAAVDLARERTTAPLVVRGDVIAGVVTGPGPFSFALDWTADVRTSSGRSAVTLPAPRAATARAVVRVPGEPGDLRTTGAVVTARRRTADGATMLDLALVPGAAAELSWIARDDAPTAPAGPARVVSDVATVVTLTDTDVRVSALVTLDVSRGRLGACTLALPAGYRVAAVHGETVDRVDVTSDTLRVTLLTPGASRHVLLAELERPLTTGTTSVDALTVAVLDAQRERGDLAVESPGTTVLLEGSAERADRIDAREVGANVRALARWPLLAAYRYQRAASTEGPRIEMRVARFADAELAPAVVNEASAMTLLTADGRALTEVTLWLHNDRQPFTKVTLPDGGRIVSVALDDAPAKPVSGADGLRLPLLHAEQGQPAGVLRYVYLHEHGPLTRKGRLQLQLPAMDLPMAVVQWEVFVPDELRARRVEGTAIEIERFHAGPRPWPVMPAAVAPMRHAGPPRVRIAALQSGPAGQIRVRALEASGGVLPGVSVTLRSGAFVASVITNERGEAVVRDVPPGQVHVDARLAGFSPGLIGFAFDGQAVDVDVLLAIGSLQETVTVTGTAPSIDVSRTAEPPDHVIGLQQRVAGVLPIRIDVPRAGRSLQFLAPLVVDDAPRLTLAYRRR